MYPVGFCCLYSIEEWSTYQCQRLLLKMHLLDGGYFLVTLCLTWIKTTLISKVKIYIKSS